MIKYKYINFIITFKYVIKLFPDFLYFILVLLLFIYLMLKIIIINNNKYIKSIEIVWIFIKTYKE